MKARFTKEVESNRQTNKDRQNPPSFPPPVFDEKTFEALLKCPDIDARIELLNMYLGLVEAMKNGYTIHPKVWIIFEAHLGMINLVCDPLVKKFSSQHQSLLATDPANAEKLRFVAASYNEAIELMIKSILPLLVQGFSVLDYQELRKIMSNPASINSTPSEIENAFMKYLRAELTGHTENSKRFLQKLRLLVQQITFIHTPDNLFYSKCPNPSRLEKAWSGFWVSNHHLNSVFPGPHLLFSDQGLAKLTDNDDLRLSNSLHEIAHFLISEFWKLDVVFSHESQAHKLEPNTVLPTLFTEALANILGFRYRMITKKGFDRLLMNSLNQNNEYKLHSAEELLKADESMNYFEFTLFVHFILNWLYLKSNSNTALPINITGFNNIGFVLNELKHAFDNPIHLPKATEGNDLGISILSQLIDRTLSSLTKKRYNDPSAPKNILNDICRDYDNYKDQFLKNFLLVYFPHEKITKSLARKSQATDNEPAELRSDKLEYEARKSQLILKLTEMANDILKQADMRYIFHKAVEHSETILRLPLSILDETALTHLLSELVLLSRISQPQLKNSIILSDQMIRTLLDPFSFDISEEIKINIKLLAKHLMPILINLESLTDLPVTRRRIKETLIYLGRVTKEFFRDKMLRYNPYNSSQIYEISDFDYFKKFLPDDSAFGSAPLFITNLAESEYLSIPEFRFLKGNMFFCREHVVTQFLLLYLIEGSNTFFTGELGLLSDHLYHELIGHMFMSRCLRCKIIDRGIVQEIPSLLSFPPWILEGIANLVSSRFKYQPHGVKSFTSTVPDNLDVPTAQEIINSNTKLPYVYFSALFGWLMTVLGDPVETNPFNHEIDFVKAKRGLRLFIQASHELDPIDISELGGKELSEVHTERILNKMCKDKGYNWKELLGIFDEQRLEIVKHLIKEKWYPDYDSQYRTAI